MNAKNVIRLLASVVLALGALTMRAQTAPATAPAVEKTVEVNRAAKIALMEGDVRILSAAKQKRTVAVGDYLVEGENIVTGKDGELHLDMEDGGYISVRPNTKMRIVKYQANGESSDTGVFGLLEGGFRSVTGWIGKFSRDKYTVRTPAATIGIRGTDHEPYVIPKGSSEGEPGTYDKVNEGGSVIQTAAGKAEVTPNKAGFVSHDKGAKPRLLKDIPGHFRAGKHERLFMGKHAEVQSRIEKHREARRAAIKQKMSDGKSAAEKRRAQRQQAVKEKQEKREAAQKQREEAKKSREEAKKAKQVEKDDDEKGAHEKANHKPARKGHAAQK